MTVGKDVSMLFTDVINCIQTASIELKKLVYLYLINYAKSQPDLAILAVNTFVKDSQDLNPLVRALAVRTMGCIRVDKITEYLCEPLRKCLKVRGWRAWRALGRSDARLAPPLPAVAAGGLQWRRLAPSTGALRTARARHSDRAQQAQAAGRGCWRIGAAHVGRSAAGGETRHAGACRRTPLAAGTGWARAMLVGWRARARAARVRRARVV